MTIVAFRYERASGPSQFLSEPSAGQGAREGRNVSWPVTSSQPLAQDVSIPYTVTDGTATYNSDYIAANPLGTQPVHQGGGVYAGTVILPAGDTEVVVMTAHLVDDVGSESPDESYTVDFDLANAVYV